MTLLRRAISGLAWAIGGGYGAQVVSLAMFIYISRIVGPEAFGAVAVAIGIIELCRAFTTEGVATTLLAQAEFDEENYNAGFAWAIFSTLITCLALVIASPWLAEIFRTPTLHEVMPQLAPLLVLLGLCRLQETRLTQALQFRPLAGRAVFAALGGGAIGVVAASTGAGAAALIYQQIGGALISAALLWGACDWRPRLRFSKQKLFTIIGANFSLAPASLVTSLCALADGLAVAILSGPFAAGVYNLGKRVRTAMLLGLSGALDRVSLPAFARLRAHPEQLASTLEQVTGLSGLIAFPIFFGVAAIAPELVHILLGPQWASAALPIALLLMSAALGIFTMYLENVLLVFERRRVIVALRLCFLFVLMLGIALFGRFGPAAIAGATLAATIAQNLAAMWMLKRAAVIPLPPFLTSALLPLAINVAMFALIWNVRETSLAQNMPLMMRLGFLIIVGAVFYASCAWILARGRLTSAYHVARTSFQPSE